MMCGNLWRTAYALTEVFFYVLISFIASKFGKKHKTALSWAHKQFSIRVYTSINIIKAHNFETIW